jgi:hypothetical protein
MKIAPESKDAGPQNEFDKAEAALLQKQQGNPVFKVGPPRGLNPGLSIPGLKPGLSIKPGLAIKPGLQQKMLPIIPRGVESGMEGDEGEPILEGNMLFDAEDSAVPSGE